MKKIKKATNTKRTMGTTIVELLVYMGLLSIFLVLLVNILFVTLSFRLSSQSTSAINQDLRYILAKISYDLYNSDNVNIPSSPGDSSGFLSLTTLGVNNTYSIDGNGNLIVTSGGDSMSLNGVNTRVTDINFERIGTVGEKHTFKMSITLEGRIIVQGGGVDTETVETTLGTR